MISPELWFGGAGASLLSSWGLSTCKARPLLVKPREALGVVAVRCQTSRAQTPRAGPAVQTGSLPASAHLELAPHPQTPVLSTKPAQDAWLVFLEPQCLRL